MENQKQNPPQELIKVSEGIWELPITFKEGMRVPARIIASDELIKGMDAMVFDQISNVVQVIGFFVI